MDKALSGRPTALRQAGRVWLAVALAPALALSLGFLAWRESPALRALAAGAGGTSPAAPAAAQAASPAADNLELSGETIEYDVAHRASIVTGTPGNQAVLVSGKLRITAPRLEYAEATGQVKAEGGVRLEQASPDQFTLTARQLTADLKARTARAQGEVALVSGKASATAGLAVFQGKERQLILSDSPVVKLEGNELSGKEIVFTLADQKVVARGGSRVTVQGVSP